MLSPLLLLTVGLTIFIVLFLVFIYFLWKKDKKLRSNTNPTIPMNRSIVSVVAYIPPSPQGALVSIESSPGPNGYINQASHHPKRIPLRDYYMLTSFNTCISGPYDSGVVTIQALRNALFMGFRCLDFEIYSEQDTNNPIVSCSTLSPTDGVYPIQTGEPILFSDIMYYLTTYAFVSYGAINFTDPLILTLRIKTSNVNIPSKLASLFNKYSRFMADEKYNIKNMDNFGLITIPKIQNRICIFVDSITDSYLTNQEFMSYVNMNTYSEWFTIKSWNEIIPPMKGDPPQTEYTNPQITMVIPNHNLSNPTNPVGDTYHSMGYQMVAMVIKPDNDAGFIDNITFFNNNHHAFVLKPPNLCYVDNTAVPVPPPQPYVFSPQAIPTPPDIPVTFEI